MTFASGPVLALAAACGHRSLLLGAWGCGVFRNDPALVADAFGQWLADPRYADVRFSASTAESPAP